MDDRIKNDFDRALTRNPAAQAKAAAMTAEQREKLQQRAAEAKDEAELEKIVDDLVGWQRGHAPYQL